MWSFHFRLSPLYSLTPSHPHTLTPSHDIYSHSGACCLQWEERLWCWDWLPWQQLWTVCMPQWRPWCVLLVTTNWPWRRWRELEGSRWGQSSLVLATNLIWRNGVLRPIASFALFLKQWYLWWRTGNETMARVSVACLGVGFTLPRHDKILSICHVMIHTICHDMRFISEILISLYEKSHKWLVDLHVYSMLIGKLRVHVTFHK